MPTADGAVALLGDAHLRESDGEVDAFIRFLDALPGDIRTLAILGDLFAVWIGSPDLLRRHHDAVLAALARLRGRGCSLLYVEGNHDFFLGRLDRPDLFDRIATDSSDLPLAGRRAHLAHGDLVNRRDVGFDWFDAAVLSHQLGQHLAKELKAFLPKKAA